MSCFMGIDIGSTTGKGVIIRDGSLAVSRIAATGVNYRSAALQLRSELLTAAGLTAGDISATAVTGHGARLIAFADREAADLHCCARGMRRIFPGVRTIIDIQDQSSQVIRLNDQGRVTDFANGEVCASGGAYLLRVIANILQIDIRSIGPLSLLSDKPVAFTTGCSVFGESEAISRISEGFSKEDVLAGVHQSQVDRIFALLNQTGLEEPCAISGGGGLNTGLTKRIESRGLRLLVPPDPLIINALGAALLAGEPPK